jgi:outer membrane protein insertion porin family/translocation and assembly module TamA
VLESLRSRCNGASFSGPRTQLPLFLFLLVAMLACAPLPKGRYTLETLHISGNRKLDDEDIEQVLASKENTRFLGLFSGVIYDYEVFDRYVLERDLERIQRYYRARGYYRTRVRAARVELKGRGARVQIRVEEGPALLLRRVDLHGLDALPPATASRLRAAVLSKLPLQEPFEEQTFQAAKDELSRGLADLGYAYAKVYSSADVDLPANVASAGFWVEPGQKAVFGDVRIEGLGPFPEPPVRRALDIKPGTPYSQAELDEAKRALLDLGVFSAVSIEPELAPAEPEPRNGEAVRVPLVVKVERAKLRSVHLGGGVQADSLRTDVHLVAGWEDSNFMGGFRKLMFEVVPGAVIYPTRLPNFEAPERLLPEVKLRSEFRQPGTFEARTNAVVRGQASMYPVLLSGDRDPEAPVLGYREGRVSAGLERSLWKLYGTASHNVQLNSPFTYIGELDKDLGTVVVSYPELFASLDLRNDRITPHKGVYLSMNAQFAGVGGDARDVKLQPEARFYVPVTRRVTLAARGALGMLFPQNYGQTVAENANNKFVSSEERGPWVRDIQLMFLRGFFSGGSGSNRGYAPREIGPHGAVPFYNPGQTPMEEQANCAVGNPDREPAVCDLPLGGFTLWEASLELRFPLTGPLSAATFADASDVSPYRLRFRFERPHFSVGFGFRYETPVGPVRFDLGYRVPGMQAPPSPDEGVPGETFGLPIAASFGIGESF